MPLPSIPVIEEVPSKFWELAGLFLSVAQMLLARENIEKYEDKLEELADVLFKCGDACPGQSLAVKHRCRYRELRALDSAFKKWYDDVPTYTICKQGIRRGKGLASQELGHAMRKLSRMNNGYTPLAMVGKVSSGTMGFVKVTSSTRMQNYNAERKRLMNDKFLHWNKVVSIPVEQEGNYTNFSTAIESWNNSMRNWGQAFNSGAASFGNSLYGLLNSSNNNQRNVSEEGTTVRRNTQIGSSRIVGGP